MSDNNLDHALSWEDDVSQESQFVLLPEGDYDFTVKDYERQHFDGSEKMSACPMAIVHLIIAGPNGEEVTVQQRLFLHKKVEWKLSEFFICLGLKKHGEPISMRAWAMVPGLRGRCKVGNKKYDGKDYNEIKKFYDPAENPPQNASGWKDKKGW